MQGISIFVPIHNEEKYLPYSLNCVKKLDPSQIILGFDRCTDDSFEVAEKILGDFDYFIVKKEDPEWRWPLSHLMYSAFKKCRNPILYVVCGDTYFWNVERGLEIIRKNPSIGWLTWRWRDYPFSLESYMIELVGTLTRFKWFRGPTGINFCYRTSIMGEADWEGAKSIPYAIDTYIQQTIAKKGFKSVLETEGFCLHLRPKKRFFIRDYTEGFTRYIFNVGFFHILRSSILYFKPLLIAGWMKAKIRKYPRRDISEWKKL